MAQQQKDINFELNLLPVISLLAVCISFLLLTTVWINIGTLDVHQAMGEATSQEQKTPPTLWVTMGEAGAIELEVKDLPSSTERLFVKLSGRGNKIQLESLSEYAKQLKAQVPELDTAMILPTVASSYEEIISVMDEFKKNEYSQLGIAPL